MPGGMADGRIRVTCFKGSLREPGAGLEAVTPLHRYELGGGRPELTRCVVFQVLLPGHLGSVAGGSAEAWH